MFLKNVLITGSSGMLGKDICGVLDAERYQIFSVSREKPAQIVRGRHFQGDLADATLIHEVLEQSQPDIIIHCAAVVDVEKCEVEKKSADDVHVKATDILSSYKPQESRFIYISTDSVFDGVTGDYSEEDSVNPVNYYALSKHQGETITLRNNPNSAVIRTNIYGFHIPLGKSLAEWAITNLSSDKAISGFSDTTFNPLYTKQLSSIINNEFLATDYCGIWNVVSDRALSKYDFLVKLAKVFGFSESLVLESKMASVSFAARRPKNTSLNPRRLKSIVSVLPSLEAGLESLKTDFLKSLAGDI